MIWTTQPRYNQNGLAYIRKGQGDNILLIHGVGLRAEAWAAQIEALSANYCVTAVDMPGHGESAPLATPTPKLAHYCDAIAPLIETDTVVMGHSMGAMIAIELAARMPNQMRGMVAMNAIYRRTPLAAQAVQSRAAAISDQHVPDPTQPLTRWFGDHASDERAACLAWLTSVHPAAYKAAYTIFAHHDGPTDATLGAITCPALFITGADEPNSTPQMSQAMAAKTKQGQYHCVEASAHMMPMTHHTKVQHVLNDFLTRLDRHND
jgi:pimeloyl-ACP methyl ester carboxylesterase